MEQNEVEVKENLGNGKVKIIIKVAVALLIGILSFTVLSNVTSSPQFHEKTINDLNSKQITVMELSGATAAVSTTASLILGDRVAPIATKLMDLTGCFLFILCAIMLEKYLVTIMGLAAFKILIPLAALLYIIFILSCNKVFEKIAFKLAGFAIVIFLVIPASVFVSNLIEKTYNTNLSVTLNNAKEIEKELENAGEIIKGRVNDRIEDSNNETQIEEESDNPFVRFFNDIGKTTGKAVDDVKEKITSTIDIVTNKGKELFNKVTNTLNEMIEAIAIMMVTTCVIPILILLFFIWIVKLFFNIDIKIDNVKLPKISK